MIYAILINAQTHTDRHTQAAYGFWPFISSTSWPKKLSLCRRQTIRSDGSTTR